jgi:hypothetical protein
VSFFVFPEMKMASVGTPLIAEGLPPKSVCFEIALFGRSRFADFPRLTIQFQILCAWAGWCMRGQEVANDADRHAGTLLRDHLYLRSDDGLDVRPNLLDTVFK